MNKWMRSIFTLTFSALLLVLTAGLVWAAATSAGTPIVIATTPADSKDPDIAVSNGITHVVWMEAGWIMHSYSAGITWTAPISIATGDDPSLAVDNGGTPQLAFTEFFSPAVNVYHTRYNAGAWTAPLKVSSGVNNASLPDITAAPNGVLSIVWSEQSLGTPQIMLAQSTNSGAAWPLVGPVLNITGSAPKIAYGSDNALHLIWQDNTNAPYRIKHTQRITSTWSLPVLVSDNSASSFAPDLTAETTQAHIVWQQLSSIQYARGNNVTWTAPIVLSGGSASEPAIAAMSNGTLLAAWDAGTTIAARQSFSGSWSAEQSLGANVSGIGHVALARGQANSIAAAFSEGASGSRDIAYNAYTPVSIFNVYLPAVLRGH